MTLAEQFGRNLRAQRRRRGLTQATLATMAGITRDGVYKLERGHRTPRLETVARLCDALCIEPNDLMEGLGPVTDPAPHAATLEAMAKQSKKPADLNRLAAAIVGDATDETPQGPETPEVRAGRNGGRKGGAARAEALTPERRSEIARKAAEARWAASKR